jgi:hypothetical protein
MGQIKGHGDAGNSVWRKPFIGEPEVRVKQQSAALEFSSQFGDGLRKKSALDPDMQVAHWEI